MPRGRKNAGTKKSAQSVFASRPSAPGGLPLRLADSHVLVDRGRLGHAGLVLGLINSDDIGQGLLRSSLPGGVPREHDLNLDAQHTCVGARQGQKAGTKIRRGNATKDRRCQHKQPLPSPETPRPVLYNAHVNSPAVCADSPPRQPSATTSSTRTYPVGAERGGRRGRRSPWWAGQSGP